VPTHDEDRRFLLDWERLTPERQAAFLRAVRAFVEDLRRGQFRKGLRVKRVGTTADVWEMTWAKNGRATFTYGPSKRPGDPHIIWRRIGGHEILDNP
jgi:hypothetical protein